MRKIFDLIKSGKIVEYTRNGKLKEYVFYRNPISVFIRTSFYAIKGFLDIKRKHIQKYSLKELNAGLKEGPLERGNAINDEGIKRLIAAYSRSKRDQKEQPPEYQISGIWLPILNKCHGKMTEAVNSGDLSGLKDILNNFGINSISKGLSLSGGIPRTIIEKVTTLNAYNMLYHKWKELTDVGPNPEPYAKEIGNLPGVLKDGNLYLKASFRLSYYAARVRALLPSESVPVFAEIGGGYGGVPYHFFREHSLKATYLDFDIPEVAMIASYFLMNVFPDKKFLFYGERDLSEVSVDEYDIIVMPNYAIRDLSGRSCDLIFNSHSLTEMEPRTIKEYLRQIQRISRRYFLHANCEFAQKREYETADGRINRQVSLNESEFTPQKDVFKMIYRIPESLQNISNRYDGDAKNLYYEYLYERIS